MDPIILLSFCYYPLSQAHLVGDIVLNGNLLLRRKLNGSSVLDSGIDDGGFCTRGDAEFISSPYSVIPE